jgi:predicted dehydrogenase
MGGPIRVGIVGANAERGWARDAHVDALAALPDLELDAVSARNQDLAEAARAAFKARRAFGDSLALARDPDIDLVTVSVKVPEHRAVVLAALAAGKHVYCEWPLGRDLAEAEEMAGAVGPKSHVAIGLQALCAPAVREAARLVREGAIGRPQVVRVFSASGGWGASAPPFYAYLQDKRNGATLETITGGHTLAAIEAIAGGYREVDARLTTRLKRVPIMDTGEEVERTCADHMLVLGAHEGGCVSTLEVTGGEAKAPFYLEVVGERGRLKITGAFPGGYQVANLELLTSLPETPRLNPVTDLKNAPANVAEVYAQLASDIRAGARTVPDFAAAVRLTRLLDAIDEASVSGRRQTL